MIAFKPLPFLLRSRVNVNVPSTINRSFHQLHSAHNVRLLIFPSATQSSSSPFLTTSLRSRSIPIILSSSLTSSSTPPPPLTPPKPKPTQRKDYHPEIIAEQIRLSTLQTKDPKGILALIDSHSRDFNGRQHSTAYHLLKQLNNQRQLLMVREDRIYREFVRLTASIIRNNHKSKFFNMIDLGMLIVSAAKIGKVTDGTDLLFKAISKQSGEIVKFASCREIANICNSYAKLEISEHQEYFDSINGSREICEKIMQSGDIQAISNIATSYATLNIGDHENYFNALSEPEICQLIMNTVSILWIFDNNWDGQRLTMVMQFTEVCFVLFCSTVVDVSHGYVFHQSCFFVFSS